MAQNHLINRVDSVIDKYKPKAHFDPTYLSQPDTKWTFQLRTNISGTTFHTDTHFHDETQQVYMKSHRRLTLGVSGSYRGLSASLSMNPAKLIGRQTDYELNVRAYGNKFGGEIMGVSSKTMSGTFLQEEITSRINGGVAFHNALYLNGYYVFNNKRFSYPAAFTMSYLQRKSVGSWLLGASMFVYQTETEKPISNISNATLRGIAVGIGGGYGYNWVPQKNWLVHISAIPTFAVYETSELQINDNHDRLDRKYPGVIIAARGAVIYRHNRMFYGMNMNYNYSIHGSATNFHLQHQKYRVRAFAGISF